MFSMLVNHSIWNPEKDFQKFQKFKKFKIFKNCLMDLKWQFLIIWTQKWISTALLAIQTTENSIFSKKVEGCPLFKERREVIFSSDLTYVHLKADSMPFCWKKLYSPRPLSVYRPWGSKRCNRKGSSPVADPQRKDVSPL